MITISNSDDDDYDEDEIYEPTPAIESINMVLVGMQELYEVDPIEMVTLIEQIYMRCSDKMDPHTFIRQLQKRALAIKAAQDAQLGITPLN